jgi:hypothetical protein
MLQVEIYIGEGLVDLGVDFFVVFTSFRIPSSWSFGLVLMERVGGRGESGP